MLCEIYILVISDSLKSRGSMGRKYHKSTEMKFLLYLHDEQPSTGTGVSGGNKGIHFIQSSKQ